jgi:arsenite transporter
MYVGRILSTLGGQGPMLLVISLCAGLVITPFAHLGYDLYPFRHFFSRWARFLRRVLPPLKPAFVRS